MSIVLVIAVGVGILLILLFFAVNKWSNVARDRQKSAGLRGSRDMTPPDTEDRGTGIN